MDKRTKTKLFLDSGNPKDTQKVLDLLDSLDGQTTNPSLVAQNPELSEKIKNGNHLSESELLGEYKKIINEIKEIIPNGSISIEVYADLNTKSEEMIKQALEFNTWIDNAQIKLPTNHEGLIAATELTDSGVNLNMTLCFSQQQAAAVYSATKNASSSSVYVSPFIGRLDDIGLQGIDLIANIKKMYESGDHHVELLAASVRNLKQFLYCLYLEVDIITAPLKVYEEWASIDRPIPGVDLDIEQFIDMGEYLETKHLQQIHYEEITLNQDKEAYDINHELTTKGIAKFAQDWNALLDR
jgi:transaldolase